MTTTFFVATATWAAGESLPVGNIVLAIICVSFVLTLAMAILSPFVRIFASALSGLAFALGVAGRWFATFVSSPLCALLQLVHFLLTVVGLALAGWGGWMAFRWASPDTPRPLVVFAFAGAFVAWMAGALAQLRSRRHEPRMAVESASMESVAMAEETPDIP